MNSKSKTQTHTAIPAAVQAWGTHNGYADYALGILKDRGYRMTRPRRLVADVLAQNDASLSPYDIHEILKSQGETIDTVSIYRILECLEENHLIHRLLLQYGKVLKCRLHANEDTCERHQADHCHHFLICEGCGRIEEIHCAGLADVALQVSTETGFEVRQHHLEFVGRCKACQESATL